MKASGIVEINNCPYESGFEVARVVANQLWHFGTYESLDKAEEVARELGEDAIVTVIPRKSGG